MADDANLESHVATYDRITGLLKWGAVAVFIIAFAVIWLIS